VAGVDAKPILLAGRGAVLASCELERHFGIRGIFRYLLSVCVGWCVSHCGVMGLDWGLFVCCGCGVDFDRRPDVCRIGLLLVAERVVDDDDGVLSSPTTRSEVDQVQFVCVWVG